MRHRKKKGKLGVEAKHRKALMRNLVKSLVQHKRIRTTVVKAKATSSYADKMVQLAKKGDLHARRTLISHLGCAQTADVLIEKIAPHFKSRNGGYTRVIKVGDRPGDRSEMAIIEFTEQVLVTEAAPKKKKKKAESKKTASAEETTKAKKGSKKEAKEESSESESTDKKESEKKGGFLGALRKFLKSE